MPRYLLVGVRWLLRLSTSLDVSSLLVTSILDIASGSQSLMGDSPVWNRSYNTQKWFRDIIPYRRQQPMETRGMACDHRVGVLMTRCDYWRIHERDMCRPCESLLWNVMYQRQHRWNYSYCYQFKPYPVKMKRRSCEMWSSKYVEVKADHSRCPRTGMCSVRLHSRKAHKSFEFSWTGDICQCSKRSPNAWFELT